MKALKVVLVVLGIAGIAVVAVVAYLVEDNLANKRADRAMNKPADRAMVAKVDKAVSQALATDAELTQRLGPFVRLEGSGYERLHYAFMLIERMVTSREAVFQQGTIALEIIIFCSEARDLDELPVGPISWKAPNRVTEGDFLEVSVSIDYRERYQSPEERAPWPMPLTSVELSPDTGTVFLGRMDKVEIWDRETQENVRNIEGRFGIVHDVFQETNSGPLVIDTDNRLKVVDPATGTFAGSFPSGHRVEGPRAAIGPDGRVLIQLHYSQVFVKGGPMKTEMAKVHDLENGASSTLILTGPPPAKADSVLLAPDGRHALLGAMQCWDLETETPAWTKEFSGDHSGHPLALFTPLTGRLCVYRASSSASSPEIWNTATGEVEATLELPKKTIWNDFRAVANNVFHPIMTVSPDERFLALGFDNGRVLVWNLPSGRLAGLVYNTDWKLEGSLANENQKEWQDPPSQRRGFKGIIIGKPYRGQKLAAIGFDASNRLIGVSLFPHVAWVWKTNTKGLR